MAQSEIYKENKRRVYDIYATPKEDRSNTINIHHIVCRSDLGVLVPEDFDIDAKSNLYPLDKNDHEELHERLRYLEG